MAQVNIPDGFRFTGKPGAAVWNQLTGNLPDPSMEAVLEPLSEDEQWTIIFEYHDVGYVKDDEKDELDANAMLETFREAEGVANQMRAERGLATLHDTRWRVPPKYDDTTKNLVWATEFDVRENGQPVGSSVNYNIRLLGRGGYVSAVLLCDPADLDRVLPKLGELMGGFEFVSGQRYAEFQSGDKIAEYGLTALVVGGAAAVGVKTGLFAWLGVLLVKLKKGIVLIVAAVVAGIGAIWRKITGRGQETATE